MSETTTPRTDAQLAESNNTQGLVNLRIHGAVPADFARTLERELSAAKDDLATAIEDANRSRQIIYEMSDALKPNEGESNIDCAKRVASELSAAIRDRDEERAKISKIKRIADIAEKVNDAASETAVALGASFAEAMMATSLDNLEKELAAITVLRDSALARIAELDNRLGALIRATGEVTFGGAMAKIRALLSAEGDRWLAAHQSASVRVTSNPDDPNCRRQ